MLRYGSSGYRLDIDTTQVDAIRFERLAEDGNRVLAGGDPVRAAGLPSRATAPADRPSRRRPDRGTMSCVFRDRDDAGRQLGIALAHYAERPDVVVLGLPRGGVVVAARVAELLHARLDVVVARKIPTPGHRELAMGALAVWGDDDTVVRNEHVIDAAGVPFALFEAERRRELDVARRRAAEWSPVPPELAGRTVIAVDDGLATGATMRAALDVLHRAGPAHLVAAVPVAAAPELPDVRRRVNDLVCVSVPDRFGSVGSHYDDFDEVVDASVRRELRLARPI